MTDLLLDVQGLETRFSTRDGSVHAVNGVSFYLERGETLGLVGESGCGKSVTVMSMLKLNSVTPWARDWREGFISRQRFASDVR